MTGATDTAITDDNGHVVGVGIFDPHGVAPFSCLDVEGRSRVAQPPRAGPLRHWMFRVPLGCNDRK